ncbi:DHA2 family efflux MFS transporter permease subunit [Dellaglioa algida]|uniref:Multidrug resistance protein b n=1 Tax=Dellaglioa algida DSM 15638 TaxID=1423719 RepID=A0A0R1HHQ0_9LACO|nr:DHA2 family efflux MFS transporter permease subunit [Dellaglioa algida]KRK46110.1 multidrug resistance protein b [Dellaglioa algida DSM 15638]MDK1732119.1 DHA2 family efflux MFS transporter permease subunit [Dellaglioa algida]MDK1733645.1 DHA2 family efflux MFS transporter permease subunit [Dellaglioa algida]
MTNKKRNTIGAILLLATFAALLNQTLMITALPKLISVLNVNFATAQWLTTGYILMVGISTPLSATLYEKYSTRQIFIGIMVVFLVGSLVASSGANFWAILLGRLIQAAAGGVLTTFTMISMITINPIERRGTVMGLSMLVISAAPAIGPTLSGVMITFLPWRALFIFIIPIMLTILIIGLFILPNYSEKQAAKIDFKSFFSSSIGLTAILIGISIIREQVLIALGLIVIGTLIMVYFGRRQLTLKEPFLNIRIFKVRSFSTMISLIMLVFGILLGTELVMPMFLENNQHLSGMTAGLIMLPGAAINAIISPIVGNLYDQYGYKKIFVFGFSMLMISVLPMLLLTAEFPVWLSVVTYAIRLAGVGAVMAPATTEALKDLSPVEINHATTLTNTLRQISGSLFNTIIIVIASIPASFVIGYRFSMIFIMVISMLIGLIGLVYFRKERKN